MKYKKQLIIYEVEESEIDITYCYLMSKMKVIDKIEKDNAKHKQLMYVEYLEMIRRKPIKSLEKQS
jgi:hypothetical protein